MKVLILSTIKDVHARTVIEKLQKMNVDYKLLCLDEFMGSSNVAIEMSTKNFSNRLTVNDGEILDLQTFQSVWNRRPGSIKAQTMPEPWIEQMVEGEAQSVIGGLFRSLPCLWVNHPGKNNECAFKLWQLEVARRVGLAIPDTIVTNDPQLVREFYDSCDGKIIYKLLGEQSAYHYPKFEFPLGMPTMLVSPADYEHLDQVSLSPHLFQRCIEKAYELRVTIVGKKIFAVQIDSQAGQGAIDWRLDYSVPMAPYELPPAVHESCLNLLLTLGLNYGALDFCVTPEGEYVFLEINCGGQYYWLEHRTNLPISEEVAKLLSGRSEPLISSNVCIAPTNPHI